MDKHRPAQPAASGKQPNEGEGNRTAARDYNTRTEKFVKSGKVDKSAADAERAVNSGEQQELTEAERIGRKHAKH